MRFDEMCVRSGLAGVLRVLKEVRMLPLAGIAKPKASSLLCTNSAWLRAQVGGLLRVFKSEGDAVEYGDVIAAISDPFGERETDVITQYSGIIVGPPFCRSYMKVMRFFTSQRSNQQMSRRPPWTIWRHS